ncbi:MAG: conjugal transfer protein TraF [Chlamydiia bacterium]|nr:conjugal transfer protein TraF [Chlamydiia bacterium]
MKNRPSRCFSPCFNALKICFIASFLCKGALLFGGFYEESGNQGFYFFEDPKELEKSQKEKPKTPEEAADIMAQQREELYKLRCLAILSPSKENMIRYIEEQNKILSLSENFAKEWQYLLLDLPGLGDGFANPLAASGIEVRKKLEEANKKSALDLLGEKYFLLLFANGGDPYSEQAGKIAKQFASVTDWEIRTVSMNGLSLQDFPDFEKDKGLSQKYGVKNAPTFLIVNPETKEGFHVGVGALSVVDLIDNIYKQAKRHLLEEKE